MDDSFSIAAERHVASALNHLRVESINDLLATPVSPQTVATARAHLYDLAREGLLEAAWVPSR